MFLPRVLTGNSAEAGVASLLWHRLVFLMPGIALILLAGAFFCYQDKRGLREVKKLKTLATEDRGIWQCALLLAKATHSGSL